MVAQILKIQGRRYFLIEEREYKRLRGASDLEPSMPLPDAHGNLPALEAIRVSLARRISAARAAAGLSQAELAREARIRPETLNRIEKAKVMPDEKTVSKLQKVLAKSGKTI